MRMRHVLLLAALAAAVSALSAAGASASMPPGASYAWAQPGTAPVTTPFAQPAIPTASAVAPWAGMSYAWAQPRTAPVTTPFAQPVRH